MTTISLTRAACTWGRKKNCSKGNGKLSIMYVHVHKSALRVITHVIHDDVSEMISSSSSPRPNVYPHLGWNFSKDKWVLEPGAGVVENIWATGGGCLLLVW